MKLILFDLDGTILLSGGAGARAVNRACKKIHGIENVMDGIFPDGKTDIAILREIFKAMKRDFLIDEIDSLFREYLLFLKEEVANSLEYRVMPGIPELIKALSEREDIILGIATGNIKEAAVIKLERSGVGHYFKFGGFGSDFENREELIRIAIERGKRFLNHERGLEGVFVIGDTPLDIIHARAAGAKTVAVATGSYSVGDLEKYTPDYLFENFSDFESVLKIF
jgi:phosphoglycolate phosphatase-like HAD superfamily hydrolase